MSSHRTTLVLGAVIAVLLMVVLAQSRGRAQPQQPESLPPVSCSSPVTNIGNDTNWRIAQCSPAGSNKVCMVVYGRPQVSGGTAFTPFSSSVALQCF
jgi:hypothetical protein